MLHRLGAGARRAAIALAATFAVAPLVVLATPGSSGAAIVADTYHGVTPARVLDTRAGYPTVDGQFAGGGAIGADATLELTVAGRGGVPVTGAGSVALNVAVTNPTVGSFLTVFPAGQPRPTAASVNFVPGQTVSNMVIAKVGAGGKVSIYNLAGSVDVVVDVLGWFPDPVSPASTVRINVRPNGAGASQGASAAPSISDDGQFVAYESAATVLVPNDTNLLTDIFVRDSVANTTSRVNVDAAGAEAQGGASAAPAISGDGRYVVYQSAAVNLVPNDLNLLVDVFRFDRTTGTTERISVSSDEAEAVGGDSTLADVSRDGRYVVFSSAATNLVPGDDNAQADVFVRDVVAGTTTRVSVATGGAQGTGGPSSSPAISSDGRWVVFDSLAADLVTGDSNAARDVFLHDRQSGTTTRVNLRSDGGEGTGGGASDAVVSDDGRWVAFESGQTNLVDGDTNARADVFLRDMTGGTIRRVSVSSTGEQTANDSRSPAMTPDGRFIAFHTNASNLVPGDTNGNADVFLHDTLTGTTTAVSLAATGAVATGGPSNAASIAADGRRVVFASGAVDLVPNDGNGLVDIFLRDVGTI